MANSRYVLLPFGHTTLLNNHSCVECDIPLDCYAVFAWPVYVMALAVRAIADPAALVRLFIKFVVAFSEHKDSDAPLQ